MPPGFRGPNGGTRGPEVTPASGDWVPSMAALAIVVAAGVILARSIHLRQRATRRREASMTPALTR